MNIKYHFPIFLGLLALLNGCNGKGSAPKNAKNDYAARIAKATQFMGKQQYDSAFYFFNKAKNETGISADQRVYAIVNMAEIQRFLSDFPGSEATITQALPDLPKTTLDYAPSVYTLLGITYKEQSDYKNAIKYYNLCLQQTTDVLQRAILKNNIAVVYMDEHAFEKAIGSLTPLLQIPAVVANDETHARILDNLGYSHFRSGQQEAGIALLMRSLQLRQKINNDFGLVSSYVHLSEAYENLDPTLSEQYALSAYQTATQINSADDRLKTLAQLIETSKGPAVKKYSLVHIRLNDSISKIRQSAKNQFAKIRYDDARMKAENADLKIDKIQITNRAVVFGILFCSAIVVAMISFLFIRKKHKKEKIIEGYRAETKISKRIHDELANDIYNTITFTETQNLSEELKENLLLRLDNVYTRARDISRENSPIQTDGDYALQLRHMIEDYSSSTNRIILRGIDAIKWETISEVKRIMTYRILQELMVNMKKHSKAAFVSVQFSAEAKNIQVAYTDNGVGTNNKLFDKNGLQNVENRINAMGGTFIFDTEAGNGFRVTFTYPSEN